MVNSYLVSGELQVGECLVQRLLYTHTCTHTHTKITSNNDPVLPCKRGTAGGRVPCAEAVVCWLLWDDCCDKWTDPTGSTLSHWNKTWTIDFNSCVLQSLTMDMIAAYQLIISQACMPKKTQNIFSQISPQNTDPCLTLPTLQKHLRKTFFPQLLTKS